MRIDSRLILFPIHKQYKTLPYNKRCNGNYKWVRAGHACPPSLNHSPFTIHHSPNIAPPLQYAHLFKDIDLSNTKTAL